MTGTGSAVCAVHRSVVEDSPQSEDRLHAQLASCSNCTTQTRTSVAFSGGITEPLGCMQIQMSVYFTKLSLATGRTWIQKWHTQT